MTFLNELSSLEFWYFIFFVAIIGLCIGSFSNVVILRGLSGESIILPPSKCPKCHNKLNWYDNIPLFSYIFLRGKCRYCKEKISIQYPVVEAITSMLFIFAFLHDGFSLTTLFMFLILSMFIILSVTDLKEQVILTPHAYVLAILGILYNYIVQKEFLLPVLGIIVGFLTIEIFARLGLLFFGKRAFGEGDAYIGAAIGAIIGWKLFLSSLIVAVIIQTILILPKFLYELIKSKQFLLLSALFMFGMIAPILMFVPKINFILYSILFITLIISGIVVIMQVFKSAKNVGLHPFPFGPAMLISAFLFIFFKNYLTMFMF